MRLAIISATLAASLAVAAGCGGKSTATPATPGDDVVDDPAEDPPATDDDPRTVQLRIMTDLLAGLAGEVETITERDDPSDDRCAELAGAVTTWGEEHYEAYEIADGEGTYLGLSAADIEDSTLRSLARQLARASAQLIELVDEDCLYGSGGYGDALYEYLVAYQGLAHWVREGDDPDVWDYEALIAEDV